MPQRVEGYLCRTETKLTETIMNLPDIVTHYFEADTRNDVDAVLQCFATDAVVEDERSSHQGLVAIRRWWIAAKQASQYIAEPIESVGDNATVDVRARISGAFAGSPIVLMHSFTVENGKIVRLEIR
jgi:ketosteroid isomerase-like protein